MKGKILLKIHDDGYSDPRGDVEGARWLAAWLSSDNPGIEDPYEDIESHAQEKRPFAYHGMGNNSGIYQFENYVFVRSETDRLEEIQVLMTAEQVRSLLAAYDAFWNGHRSPTTIDVEFIATGKEAKTQFEKLAGVELGKPLIIEWIDEENAAEAAAKGRA
ncbi:MAG: hypothetical protein H6883_08225 [Rhodobiaceae bacterium]|nr:hypothetical protein [Rhodobiaceae bacterium]